MTKFTLSKKSRMDDSWKAVAAHDGDKIRVSVDDTEACLIKRLDTRVGLVDGRNDTGYPRTAYLVVYGSKINSDKAMKALGTKVLGLTIHSKRQDFYEATCLEAKPWDTNIWIEVTASTLVNDDGTAGTDTMGDVSVTPQPGTDDTENVSGIVVGLIIGLIIIAAIIGIYWYFKIRIPKGKIPTSPILPKV